MLGSTTQRQEDSLTGKQIESGSVRDLLKAGAGGRDGKEMKEQTRHLTSSCGLHRPMYMHHTSTGGTGGGGKGERARAQSTSGHGTGFLERQSNSSLFVCFKTTQKRSLGLLWVRAREG